jgi:hypothetical protein
MSGCNRKEVIAIGWEIVDDVNGMVKELGGIDIGIGSGASIKITFKKNLLWNGLSVIEYVFDMSSILFHLIIFILSISYLFISDQSSFFIWQIILSAIFYLLSNI